MNSNTQNLYQMMVRPKDSEDEWQPLHCGPRPQNSCDFLVSYYNTLWGDVNEYKYILID